MKLFYSFVLQFYILAFFCTAAHADDFEVTQERSAPEEMRALDDAPMCFETLFPLKPQTETTLKSHKPYAPEETALIEQEINRSKPLKKSKKRRNLMILLPPEDDELPPSFEERRSDFESTRRAASSDLEDIHLKKTEGMRAEGQPDIKKRVKKTSLKKEGEEKQKNKGDEQDHQNPIVRLMDVMEMKHIPKKSQEYWNLAWHARLADYGDRDSQFLMARAYEMGKQVPVDEKKALSFYKMAAQNEHLEACMQLGEIYESDRLGPPEPEQALFWYERGAELGYVPAQMKTARIYEAQQDYQNAYHWMEKAMRQVFPGKKNLIHASPELERMALLAGIVITPEQPETTDAFCIATPTPTFEETIFETTLKETTPVFETTAVIPEMPMKKLKKLHRDASFFGVSMRE